MSALRGGRLGRATAALLALAALLPPACDRAPDGASRDGASRDGASRNGASRDGDEGDGSAASTSSAPARLEDARASFCASCHLDPAPDVLPRAAWRAQIELMYELARGDPDAELSGAPPLEAVVRWYEERAPRALPGIDSTARAGPGPAKLARRPWRIHAGDRLPAVSSIALVDLARPARARPDVLVSDMRHGHVLALRPPAGAEPARIVELGEVPHPGRATTADLDRDGRVDVLVANLGTMTPSDELVGSVEWLRAVGDLEFERRTLLEGVGRVADVRAADFDRDGDLDVLVAVFGWRRTGHIALLENTAAPDAEPRFEARPLDPRAGAIATPVADLDGDGDLDFLALLAQQHESVIAFLGRGDGTFDKRSVHRAAHPVWGATGLDLADLDGDGDLDALLTNGDSLDDLVVKPYHGVSWLENRGRLDFVHHRITDLYGAHAARAGDLDGDGDLDIVVGAFLPLLDPSDPSLRWLESIVWLEQTRIGEFARHSLETVTADHPVLDVGDVDGDGDVDVVVGNLTMAKGPNDTLDHDILFLENERVQGDASATR